MAAEFQRVVDFQKVAEGLAATQTTMFLRSLQAQKRDNVERSQALQAQIETLAKERDLLKLKVGLGFRHRVCADMQSTHSAEELADLKQKLEKRIGMMTKLQGDKKKEIAKLHDEHRTELAKANKMAGDRK